jgi:hypothetical protein
VEKTKEILTMLKENLEMVQNMVKKQAKQHRNERQFEEGDWVFFRLQPYNYKLAPKIYGLYKIIQKIG